MEHKLLSIRYRTGGWANAVWNLSLPTTDRATAEARLAAVRRMGYEAEIVDYRTVEGRVVLNAR